MTAPFEAKYRGVCASCEEPIRPGDLIRFEDDATVHDDCTDSHTEQRQLWDAERALTRWRDVLAQIDALAEGDEGDENADRERSARTAGLELS